MEPPPSDPFDVLPSIRHTLLWTALTAIPCLYGLTANRLLTLLDGTALGGVWRALVVFAAPAMLIGGAVAFENAYGNWRELLRADRRGGRAPSPSPSPKGRGDRIESGP